MVSAMNIDDGIPDTVQTYTRYVTCWIYNNVACMAKVRDI
jgi:hypothetical protein